MVNDKNKLMKTLYSVIYNFLAISLSDFNKFAIHRF